MSERKWAELAAATESDGVLQRVIRSITEGKANCPNPYVTFVDELCVVDGVILKNCGSRQHESTDAYADPRGTLGNREM